MNTVADIAAPVKAAFEAFEEALAERDKGMVPYAIKVGEACADAQKKVEGQGLNWHKWATTNLVTYRFSTSTIRDYIMLAKYHQKDPAILQHAVSIRNALAKVEVYRVEKEAKPPAKTRGDGPPKTPEEQAEGRAKREDGQLRREHDQTALYSAAFESVSVMDRPTRQQFVLNLNKQEAEDPKLIAAINDHKVGVFTDRVLAVWDTDQVKTLVVKLVNELTKKDVQPWPELVALVTPQPVVGETQAAPETAQAPETALGSKLFGGLARRI